MDISERLRELREKSGYSQEDLAQKLNISRQSISKWELGKSTPDITYFIKLSEIYNLSLDKLVKGEEYEKENIINNMEEIVDELKEKNDGKLAIIKKGIRFYKKDFKYRHTNPELVKIKTIGWLIIIGILTIFAFIRK